MTPEQALIEKLAKKTCDAINGEGVWDTRMRVGHERKVREYRLFLRALAEAGCTEGMALAALDHRGRDEGEMPYEMFLIGEPDGRNTKAN